MSNDTTDKKDDVYREAFNGIYDLAIDHAIEIIRNQVRDENAHHGFAYDVIKKLEQLKNKKE